MSVYTVSNATKLASTLKLAQSGDTISLQAGVYSGVSFKGMSFATGVTITSADAAHRAVLNNFTIEGASGLTFSNLEVVASNPEYAGIAVYNSTNLTFDKIYLHGSLDNNAGNDINGMAIYGSTNVSLTNSELEQLCRGVVFSDTNGIVVSGNNVHNIRSDGLDFAQVSNVKIVANVIKNFAAAPGDHPDGIQFWTSGTRAASHDILISGNQIIRGDGSWSEGIFMADETGVMPYERVTISENIIVGTGYNAIRIIGAKDLTVTRNEMVSFSNDPMPTTFLLEKVTNVVSSYNKGTNINYGQATNLTQIGNTITAAVADRGAAALQQWLSAHQDFFPASGATTALAPTTITIDRTAAEATGTAYDNVVLGDYRDNRLLGLAGNDTLDGGGGFDTLTGGVGNDTYILPNSQAQIVEQAGEGVDTVIARGDYTLGANVENLVISSTVANSWAATGNELDNKITGNAGDNRLVGNAGNDTLDGGAGADRLTGGLGADVFRFAPGSGRDVITDLGFGVDRDVVDVSAFTASGITSVIQDVGADAVIRFSNGDTITLLGVHANELGATAGGWIL